MLSKWIMYEILFPIFQICMYSPLCYTVMTNCVPWRQIHIGRITLEKSGHFLYSRYKFEDHMPEGITYSYCMCSVLAELQDVVWSRAVIALVPVCYLLGRDNKCLAVSVNVLPGPGFLLLGRWVRKFFLLCALYIPNNLFIIRQNRKVYCIFIYIVLHLCKPLTLLSSKPCNQKRDKLLCVTGPDLWLFYPCKNLFVNVLGSRGRKEKLEWHLQFLDSTHIWTKKSP